MRVSALVAAALLVTFLLPVQFHSAEAVSSCTSDICWTQVDPPVLTQLATYQSFKVTYNNTISVSMTGMVFMVVHNSLGQTVQISISSLQLAPGANGSAFPILLGLPSGNYTATFFATTPGDVAISTASVQTFSI